MSHSQTTPASLPDMAQRQQQSHERNAASGSRYHALPENLEGWLADARPRLLRFARLQGVSPDAADDVVQETFLEAWRHLNRLHTPQGIDAWLTSICRNVCLRWARRQGMNAVRQTSLFAAEPEEQETESALEHTLPNPLAFDPAEEMSRQELASLLDRAMGFLPQRTREAIELCYLAELPQREAALRLGVTINALEVRLHRARAQLRQTLSGALRADAEAFGLLFDQEASLGWRETREWCNLCGQHRLRGLFEPQPDGRVYLILRCPGCSPRYGNMFNCSLASVAGFHSFRSAYKHVWKVAFAHWMQMLAEGNQRCPICQQHVQPQIGRPDEFTRSHVLPDNYRIILDCPTCGLLSNCSVSALLAHPSIFAFTERHPRWHIGTESALDYAGQSAIRTSLIDTTSAARLTVIAQRQTLQTLAIFPE